MSRPILHLKPRPVAALLSALPNGSVASVPESKLPVSALTRKAPTPKATTLSAVPRAPIPLKPAGPTRTQDLIAALERHTGKDGDTLARELLLPDHYRANDERQAVLLTAAIQLWLEGAVGDADFSSAEETRVIARAQQQYQWTDPRFTSNSYPPRPATPRSPPLRPPRHEERRVQAPHQRPPERRSAATARPTPASGIRPLTPPEMSREERWNRLQQDMCVSNLPHGLIARLSTVKPVSRHHLSHMIQSGRLRPLRLSREHQNILRGWLRLPLLPPSKKTSLPDELREFSKQVREWEKQTLPKLAST